MSDLVARIRAWAAWEPPVGKIPPDYPVPEPVEWAEALVAIEARDAMLRECVEALRKAAPELDENYRWLRDMQTSTGKILAAHQVMKNCHTTLAKAEEMLK